MGLFDPEGERHPQWLTEDVVRFTAGCGIKPTFAQRYQGPINCWEGSHLTLDEQLAAKHGAQMYDAECRIFALLSGKIEGF